MKGKKAASSNIIPEHGAHVPEDKDQLLIETPYGPGLVVRTRRIVSNRSSLVYGTWHRDDQNVIMREIELTGWSSSSEVEKNEEGSAVRPTMLYSPVDFASIPPVVGSDVLCPFGRGRVVEVRQSSTTEGPIHGVVVRLSSWRLARRCTVTCYLDVKSVHVVRSKKIYEMSVVEKIERAMELKQEAANQFGQRQYEAALSTYTRAVDAVKYVQHTPDSTNVIRADLLVVMITCCNNAATCCMKLNKWDDALKHAQQAVALLDALENKKGSLIQQELHRQGVLDVRLFGEWKVKSLLITAGAFTEKDEVESALDAIKKAREVIAIHTSGSDPTEVSQLPLYQQSINQLTSNNKELLKLSNRCKERRKIILKKEKMRAQAMFASSTTVDDVTEAQSPFSHKAKRDEEEKKQDSVSSYADKNVVNETVRNSAPNTAAAVPAGHVTGAKSDETSDGLPWYNDPFLLGGLGVVVGTLGTLLLLSQLVALPKRQS